MVASLLFYLLLRMLVLPEKGELVYSRDAVKRVSKMKIYYEQRMKNFFSKLFIGRVSLLVTVMISKFANNYSNGQQYKKTSNAQTEQLYYSSILVKWLRCRFLDTKFEGSNPGSTCMLCPCAKHFIRIASVDSAVR